MMMAKTYQQSGGMAFDVATLDVATLEFPVVVYLWVALATDHHCI